MTFQFVWTTQKNTKFLWGVITSKDYTWTYTDVLGDPSFFHCNYFDKSKTDLTILLRILHQESDHHEPTQFLTLDLRATNSATFFYWVFTLFSCLLTTAHLMVCVAAVQASQFRNAPANSLTLFCLLEVLITLSSVFPDKRWVILVELGL